MIPRAPESMLHALRSHLRQFRFNFCSEKDLQSGIEQVLAGRFTFRREVPLNAKDRPDFLIDESIVLEVKIGGSAAEVMRQIARYAACDQVSGILLVTNRAKHSLPATFNGKPLVVHSLLDGAL